MSAVGKRVWMHMQDQEPPYNRETFSQLLKKTGAYPVAPQSVSNYLYREHPPTGFINAVVDLFELGEDEEMYLHWLYFRGREFADEWLWRERASANGMSSRYDLAESERLEARKRERREAERREAEKEDRAGDGARGGGA